MTTRPQQTFENRASHGAIFVQTCETKGRGIRMAETLQTARLPRQDARKQRAAAVLTALGVVYGDIGTSPLYGLKQAVQAVGAPTPDTLMGIVSLIIWSLLLIVTLKYAILILRADNHGEGGIVALLALLDVRHAPRGTWRASLLIIGLVGAALLYGDGVIAPEILAAFSPHHAVLFLLHAGPTIGFAVLGAAFLVLTGAEAMYADMGHFGRRTVQVGWFAIVMPALMINYLGQGGLILADQRAVENPFFLLAPRWAHYPMVTFATVATVIASQAIISGAYSLTQQAMQLGLLPRMRVRHTASHEK